MRKVDSEVSDHKEAWDAGHGVLWVGRCGGSAVPVADMERDVEKTVDVFDLWSPVAAVRTSRDHSSSTAGSFYASGKTIYCSSVKSRNSMLSVSSHI